MPFNHRPARGFSILLASCLLASVGLAHVGLDSPNGGVVLRAGTFFRIEWRVVIAHNTENWDLWYSTTGSQGPWIPIALDLPPGDPSTGAMHFFDWLVPADVSGQVFVRVQQDNTGVDYQDVSNGANSIVLTLTSSTPTMSLLAGGAHVMTMDGGPEHAGFAYVLAGSVTATSPGIPLGPGLIVPLFPDWYFELSLMPNPFLSGTQGSLDSGGVATATLTLPPGMDPALQGATVWHAFVALSPTEVRLVSNPDALTFVP
jgi:hypothetical protein